MSEPKMNIKEETSAKKTRSPPKKAKVEQSVPKTKKLKTDAEKTAEKAQHLRFGKAELTPDELSRLSKAQKREMYAAHAARSAVHREVDQYEDDNVGTQALSEGEKAAGNVRDISKSRYARKLKRKAKMQGKKGARNAKSSVQKPTAAQDTGASGTGEGGSNWLSRWRQKQDIRQSYYAAARSGTAAQTAGGKAASNGASAARSGVEQAVEKGKTAVSTAVKGARPLQCPSWRRQIRLPWVIIEEERAAPYFKGKKGLPHATDTYRFHRRGASVPPKPSGRFPHRCAAPRIPRPATYSRLIRRLRLRNGFSGEDAGSGAGYGRAALGIRSWRLFG